MFEKIFTKIQEQNPKIRVIGIWGKDGLELEKKFYSETQNLDFDLIGAEIADVISKIDASPISPQSHYSEINLKQHVLFAYSLTRDYFLIVLSDVGTLPGKLKFYVDVYKNQFISCF